MTFFTLIPHAGIADRNQLHKVVMAMFPDHQTENARAAANILFRVQQKQGHAGPVTEVLVSSTIRPTRLLAGARVIEHNPVAGLADGDTVRFRIDINPIRRRSVEDETGRRRIVETVVPADGIAGYLGEKLGDALDNIAVVRADADHALTDRRSRGQGTNKLLIVTIHGTAKVADIHALREYVECGVGRGRSFGAGMLAVAAPEAKVKTHRALAA